MDASRCLLKWNLPLLKHDSIDDQPFSTTISGHSILAKKYPLHVHVSLLSSSLVLSSDLSTVSNLGMIIWCFVSSCIPWTNLTKCLAGWDMNHYRMLVIYAIILMIYAMCSCWWHFAYWYLLSGCEALNHWLLVKNEHEPCSMVFFGV